MKNEVQLRTAGIAGTRDACAPTHAIESVSVLIPTFNGDEFLERLLDALVNQVDAYRKWGA